MRVLLFSDADVFAGTERHMLDLAIGLREEGVQPVIASPLPSVLQQRANAAGLPYIAIQKGGLIDRPAITQLSELFRTGEIDLIHAHNGRTMLSSAIAAGKASGKAVATHHFIEPDHAGRRGPRAVVYSAAHRWVSARLAGHIAISDAVKQAMVARREVPETRIAVVHNGMSAIDVSSLAPPAAMRAALGVPDDNLLIVCAARLEAEKDIASLIRAAEEVSKRRQDVTCLIAGAGALKVELEGMISGMKLDKTIRLLGYREDVLSIIGACDLFVLPSLAEPFGLVLLEAMALGKPVIATDAGGPREIVVDGVTGLLTPPANPTKLANALTVALNDRKALMAMGERGYARFNEKFSLREMSLGMIAVYSMALNRQAA